MDQYRIITDGQRFKVQERVLFFFWKTEQKIVRDDDKDFGGDLSFEKLEEAKEYINLITPKKWVVVKT